jgi:hypothetical protein
MLGHKDALRFFTLAEKLNMPYDAGRAHLEIGRHVDAAPGDRRKFHLERAVACFEKVGARHDLQRARDALTTHAAG